MPQFHEQPDGAAGLDVFSTSKNPTTNYGANTALNVGAYEAVFGIEHLFIEFDWSSIPAGQICSTATLRFTLGGRTGNAGGTIKLYRVRRAWVEGELTWEIFASGAGNNWVIDGGASPKKIGFGTSPFGSVGFGAPRGHDYDNQVVASLTLTDTEALGDKDFILDPTLITPMLPGGGWTNNGFVLRFEPETGLQRFSFRSSDYATAGDRPEIWINYGPPYRARGQALIWW